VGRSHQLACLKIKFNLDITIEDFDKEEGGIRCLKKKKRKRRESKHS